MTVEAFAKVNFTLEVLGVRTDGYHDLRSLVVPVSLADTVTLEPAERDDFRLETQAGVGSIDLARIGPPERNLAVRAAALLRRLGGIRDRVRISIRKRIPLGGGLGGGSADAAAVLNGLNELWHLGVPRATLAVLGADLGSDVPALVLGGPVLMEGRGERVCRWKCGKNNNIDGKIWNLVLLNPGVFCSTPEIFKYAASGLTNRPEILHNIGFAISDGKIEAVADALQNDLAEAAMFRYPAIRQAARALSDAGAVGVSMTGSGSTVFGLVRNPAHGQEVQSRLAEAGWTASAQTCPVV